MTISVGTLMTIIGLLCTLAGLVIGLVTFNRNRDKDVRGEASRNAVIETKLDNISYSVNSMALDLKASEQRWSALSTELARVDESTKSAHKRIDTLEKECG